MRGKKLKTVFVFDGRSRAALQIIRSLGKKDLNVFIGNESRLCSSFFSKYTHKRIKYPEPNSDEFEDFIFSLIKKRRFDAIIPVRDDTTLFCAKHKGELSKYTNLLVSDYETVYLGRDKSETFEMANEHGVPIPKTNIVKSIEQIRSYGGDFPIVLKPAISSGSRGLYVIHNRKALSKIPDTLFQSYDKYLLQDYIPSEKTEGVNMIFDKKGSLVASFSYKRVREYPRNGGPSVLRESTQNEELINLCVNFLSDLQWEGVAMMEFKIDSRDNKPKLMEINPRFWGSLALPVYAGIDYPFLYYKLAKDEKVAPVLEYDVGVKARWLFLGDFLWLATSNNLPKDLSEFLKFRQKNMTYDIFKIDDIFPVVGATLEGFAHLFNKEKRKRAIDRGKEIK